MATLSGLQSGFFTDIDVVDVITINGDAGTANQVLTSDGTNTSYQDPTLPAVSELLTAGTGIDITDTGNPETISTNVKSLVLDGTAVSGAPQTFNPNADGGSQTITINDTDTQLTLVEQNGIVITDLGGTNRGIATDIDADTIVFNGTEMEVAKVPNELTFTGYDTGTFDGSSALSIDLVNTEYTAGDGIVIGGTTIEANIDEDTIDFNAGTMEVQKVPNALTAGTNISFMGMTPATTYDGSMPITISSTDTTYSAGQGIEIDGTTIEALPDGTTIDFNGDDELEVQKVPNALSAGTNLSYTSGTTFDGSSARTINLNASLTSIDSITFTSTSSSTSLTGNDYPSNPTTATNLDLTSTTNLIAGAVLATKIQRTSLFKSFTNVYSEYSSNFRTSFVAQSANVMVEFRAIVRADNKVFYGGLYDYDDGSYNADTRNRFNYNDESDQDHTVMTWWMRNLTAGTTYYISPYFRGSSSTVYIYAGHSGTTDGFAPAIMRIIDGGNNVSIY